MADFFAGKRVFVTGHTGFKGSWLTAMLLRAGAEVTGYALRPPTIPSLFELSGIGGEMHSVEGDVRDIDALRGAFMAAKPEIVFHLAAQPLVRDSYRMPVYTYETNVMGTVNLLECLRLSDTVHSFVNVTTDKVYRNFEWARGYVEKDVLCGIDPYSNSKSCSELVTSGYRDSFFSDGRTAISTARAGNVIGGGDFARDRIVPDCVRAAEKGEPILVRNPRSIRPYQHVLEPLHAYLLLARKQYATPALSDCYNIGPDLEDIVDTGTLATYFCDAWGDGAGWVSRPVEGPREANILRLDCQKIKDTLGWTPKWDVKTAVEKTVAWEKARIAGESPRAWMWKQIGEYQE